MPQSTIKACSPLDKRYRNLTFLTRHFEMENKSSAETPEKIRDSLIHELKCCLELDYCREFNRPLGQLLVKLKKCLEANCISADFGVEFLILLAQRQLKEYAALGMNQAAYAKMKIMLQRGDLKPSLCFKLMYKRIALLKIWNKRRFHC